MCRLRAADLGDGGDHHARQQAAADHMVLGGVSSVTLYLVAPLYKQLRLYAAFLILFAPATITSFVTGQTGLLASALIVGGFRLATTRPTLGGIVFGLASFKPQLGVLIPIALISARLWCTIAAACVTVLVLVLASGIAFGWSIWPLWSAKLLPHTDWVDWC